MSRMCHHAVNASIRIRDAFGGNQRAIPATLLTFTLLMSLTVGMWWSTSAEILRVSQERFDFKLTEAQFAIQQRLLAYEQILRGGVALFAASEHVTRADWHDYVRTLEIDKNFLGIQSIGYSEQVLPAQLAAHTRKIRSEEFTDYAIRPDGKRAEYTPIVYVEPFDWRNMRALGYDMRTDPVLREALDHARDTGLPSVSGKVILAQEIDDGVQSGFNMCLPVFHKGVKPVTTQERRAVMAGYVCASFRMRDLMQGILGAEQLPNIQLKIFDGAAGSSENLMYDSEEGAMATQKAASFSEDRKFEFDGRHWTLRFDSLPAFDATIEVQKPRLILLSGLLVSILFAAVVWSLALNRRRARQLSDTNAGLQNEIAERTKLELELNRAKDAAEAANQAKSDFLANVSHELRTPLTLILAPLEQLLAAVRPLTDWKTQLARAQRNALLLLSRVNDILDYSKAEAGKFELCWELVDLTGVISVLAGDAATVAEGKNCVLTWHVDPALDAVCLDPRCFGKIALNLLSNAIKFTSAGGSIQVEATLLEDDRFEFSVRDSGIGIPPDKLQLLFQRFSQVDHSATRHYSGTGIGLALVKDLAELMGGSVGVESEPDRGSRFFVRLPRGSERQPMLTSASDRYEALPQTSGATVLQHLHFQEGSDREARQDRQQAGLLVEHASLLKVLVVDDNADMRSYIAELLADEWDIVTAVDGEDAWELLQHRLIDVVVSDVMMPNLDGFGLTARIKGHPNLSQLPVILLTARGGSDASVSGLEAGADDYIAKPFSPLELKARVRAALRMSHVQSELRDRSRQAGMAEIATNVLHNVGNILNSVNISANLVSNKLYTSKVLNLTRAVQMMNEHTADLGNFLSRDEKGKLLPEYLYKLAQALTAEKQDMIEELRHLTKSIDHIKAVVATQQAYAGAASMVEPVQIRELVEDALRINDGALTRHQVAVVKNFADVPVSRLDKTRVMQILVNLISNAKHAMDCVTDRPHKMTLQVDIAGSSLQVQVSDNGEGIPPENLRRIFAHGFTTRKGGHGFGLHSCALAATEMGGSLTAHSDGPGKGAAFTLELPITENVVDEVL